MQQDFSHITTGFNIGKATTVQPGRLRAVVLTRGGHILRITVGVLLDLVFLLPSCISMHQIVFSTFLALLPLLVPLALLLCRL